ncbi:MAG: hypothetical protein KA715_07265 [Xanthomonadaceae bacterium]|nr:hypothetical protein [Xanthomonadaceae bacterium]
MGFHFVIPSGSVNKKNQRFWNAGDACCDFYNDGPDDIHFLDELISQYKKTKNINKVSLIGHSNGAFMSHHYACKGGEKIDEFFAFAGNPGANLKECHLLEKIKVIIAHGKNDKTFSI